MIIPGKESSESKIQSYGFFKIMFKIVSVTVRAHQLAFGFGVRTFTVRPGGRAGFNKNTTCKKTLIN